MLVDRHTEESPWHISCICYATFGVYISKLIRYSRAVVPIRIVMMEDSIFSSCGSYQDCHDGEVAATKEAIEPRVHIG